MTTNDNNQNPVEGTHEGEGEARVETISLSKEEYDKLNQTLGSYKRQLKDLQKPKEVSSETPKNQSEDFGLVHKTYLRAAGITAEDEVELALVTAKKWGVEIDKVVDDDDFKIKLDRLRTNKSNADAVSNVKGGAGNQQAKNTAEYWIAKGAPPTTADVPDRKTRAKIARALLANAKPTTKFYNE